jgi:hypothetical protein
VVREVRGKFDVKKVNAVPRHFPGAFTCFLNPNHLRYLLRETYKGPVF